jgi:hypothetical protein
MQLKNELCSSNGLLRGNYVYLLLCENGKRIFIKIGISHSPIERAMEIRTSCPINPGILAILRFSGRHLALKMEQRLHHAFKPWRSHGEWFDVPKSDKLHFNNILKQTVALMDRNSLRLRFEKINMAEIIARAEKKRKAVQRRYMSAPLSFKDFKRDVAACKRANVSLYSTLASKTVGIC